MAVIRVDVDRLQVLAGRCEAVVGELGGASAPTEVVYQALLAETDIH